MQENKKIRACTFQQEILVNLKTININSLRKVFIMKIHKLFTLFNLILTAFGMLSVLWKSTQIKTN
jgi:hypothetical protein